MPTPAFAVQEQLPDAKVLYSSATGASEPKNLGGWVGAPFWWLAFGGSPRYTCCAATPKMQFLHHVPYLLLTFGPLCSATAGYMTR